MKSCEEAAADPETRCRFAVLLAQLFRGWQNFLESARVGEAANRESTEALKKQIKSLEKELGEAKEEYEFKIEKMNTRLEAKPLVHQASLLRKENLELKIAIQKERREFEGQIALLTLNNKELTETLRALQENADRMQTVSKLQALSAELRTTQEQLRKEKEARSGIGFKFYTMLEASKKDLQDRERKLEATKTGAELLARDHDALQAQVKSFSDAAKERTESAAMMREDLLQAKSKLQSLKKALGRKEAETMELGKKQSELETQLKLQREGLLTQGEVNMDGLLEQFAANVEGRANNQIRADSRKDGEDKKPEEEGVAEYNPETEEYKLSSINLARYRYSRPAYLALIAGLLPPEGTKAMYAPPFPTWLNVTIRAIFDSYWNEVLLSFNKKKAICGFPEFVYAWLGSFTVDSNTKKLRGLEYTERDVMCSSNRLSLYLGLEVAMSTKLWEVHAFRDFLQETLAPDELVFYLHCRFLLFAGPQLDIPAATCCVTHFVAKDRTFELIDRVMCKFPHEQRKLLKKKLTDFGRATFKDSNAYDSAMVLRVLLEYYIKQKKENIAKFTELYKAVKGKYSSKGSGLMSFAGFYNLISGAYDADVSDTEAARLYREAYVAGGCCINVDSILLTFSESYATPTT